MRGSRHDDDWGLHAEIDALETAELSDDPSLLGAEVSEIDGPGVLSVKRRQRPDDPYYEVRIKPPPRAGLDSPVCGKLHTPRCAAAQP